MVLDASCVAPCEGGEADSAAVPGSWRGRSDRLRAKSTRQQRQEWAAAHRHSCCNTVLLIDSHRQKLQFELLFLSLQPASQSISSSEASDFEGAVASLSTLTHQKTAGEPATQQLRQLLNRARLLATRPLHSDCDTVETRHRELAADSRTLCRLLDTVPSAMRRETRADRHHGAVAFQGRDE